MMKDKVRKFLFQCNLPITMNLRNDILLKKILKKNLIKNSNVIDIGCHKGEILDIILKYAPEGHHFAIEPIPYYYENLKLKFRDVMLFSCALSDQNGYAEFYWIKDQPAYSGLKPRTFNENHHQIELIKVELKKLDDLIPNDIPIHFIKIDVEGAELNVLKGGIGLLKKHKPMVAFEFGLGGSDYYNTSAGEMFDFFHQLNYRLYSFENYLHQKDAYTKEAFEQVYQENRTYNFLAV